MPYFGVHESIAGGFGEAVRRTSSLGFDCVQIFSGNSARWSNKPITESQASDFKEALTTTGQHTPLIHDSYLINLASSDEALYAKSLARFTDELERAQLLGVPSVVMHPGAAKGDTKERAIARVAKSFDRIYETRPELTTTIFLETTAGQGSYLGGTFEELGALISACDHKDKLRVCLDTCHVFAAGYDFRTRSGYASMFEQLDAAVGLERLAAFHLNDSQKDVNSHGDRHAHLGHGLIGLDAFAMLVNDPRFQETPMYMETPKEVDEQGVSWDAINLAAIKKLLS